jgi:hypothetical protein
MKPLNTTRPRARLITLFLILTMLASVFFATTASAAVRVDNVHTWFYVGTSCGGGGAATVGVGQTMQITCWTKDLPIDIGETAKTVYSPSGRAGWDGETATVTKPDGTKDTVNFPHSDPVGNNYAYYTPTIPGKYTIVAHFPATWKNTTTVATLFSAADSQPETFTVTQTPPILFPESPLPQNYWTRPISGAARMWYPLPGNKLGGASAVYPPGASGGTTGNYYYGDSPLSAHILWSKPYTIGGIMDARYQWSGIPAETFETTHYQGVSFSASLIMDGKIYCSPRITSNYNTGLQIIDLYTGETRYLNYSDSTYNFGSIYNYNSPNQMGGFEYLWKSGNNAIADMPQVIDVPNTIQYANLTVARLGPDLSINRTATTNSLGTVLEMIDAWTRVPVCWIANASTSGTQIYGTDGSILYYSLVNKGNTTNPNYYCQVWNSSAGTMVASVDGTGYWQWRPAGGQFGASGAYISSSSAIPNAVHDGSDFYSQNFSIPSIIGPTGTAGTVQCIRQDQFMIVGSAGWNGAPSASSPGWMMGIGLNATNMGKKLWSMTYTPPFGDPALNVSAPGTFTGGLSMNGVYPEDGVLTWSDPQSLTRWVYDLYSGQLLWKSQPENQYEYYGISQVVYNHMLIGSGQYGGQLFAYDIRTGKLLWNYTSTNVGVESPYGNYPMSIAAIDGYNNVLYTITSEHHNIQPMYRGPNLRCINASNGQEVWKILDFGSGVSIADGILVKGDNLDNMIYAYGKGPSATTVTCSQDVSTQGSMAMLKGTVTDQTDTGRLNTNDALDFTLKGTPAISDASMGDWMAYMFKQQGKPTSATGVPVSLDTIDPNHNYIHIGTVTSDVNGNFGLAYKPQVPGTYQIIATFAGSNSYGPSTASTYIYVAPQTQTSPAVAPTAPAPTPAATSTTPTLPASTPTSTSPSPSPVVAPTSGAPTTTYLVVGAAVIIIFAAFAAIVIRKRQK